MSTGNSLEHKIWSVEAQIDGMRAQALELLSRIKVLESHCLDLRQRLKRSVDKSANELSRRLTTAASDLGSLLSRYNQLQHEITLKVAELQRLESLRQQRQEAERRFERRKPKVLR